MASALTLNDRVSFFLEQAQMMENQEVAPRGIDDLAFLRSSYNGMHDQHKSLLRENLSQAQCEEIVAQMNLLTEKVNAIAQLSYAALCPTALTRSKKRDINLLLGVSDSVTQLFQHVHGPIPPLFSDAIGSLCEHTMFHIENLSMLDLAASYLSSVIERIEMFSEPG